MAEQTKAQSDASFDIVIVGAGFGGLVAVGTPVTRCPPHRSVRAALPHTAPASGHDAKAGYGEGMLRYLPWVRQVMAGDRV